MRKILTTLFIFLTISLFGQDIKPISPLFKNLQSPSFSYMIEDSSVWIYKGLTYGWTKLADSARLVKDHFIIGDLRGDSLRFKYAFDGDWSPFYYYIPPRPEEPQFKFLNGYRQWQYVSSGSGGYNANLYYTTEPADIGGYYYLDYDIQPTETELTATANAAGEYLIRTYIYSDSLGTGVIDGGEWYSRYYYYINNAVGTTRLKVEILLRHTDGSETSLFSSYSDDLNSSVWESEEHSSQQPAFFPDPSDRIMAKVYLSTSTAATITIHTLVGDGRGAYFRAPIKLRHSGLRDLRWVNSGHNGDSNTLAGFGISGQAIFKSYGNLTESVSGLSFDTTRQVIGGNSNLSLDAGYLIPTTTDTTRWGAGSYNNYIQNQTATHQNASFDISGSAYAGTGFNTATGSNYKINGVQISSSNLSDGSNLAKLDGANTFTNGGNSFYQHLNISSDGSSSTFNSYLQLNSTQSNSRAQGIHFFNSSGEVSYWLGTTYPSATFDLIFKQSSTGFDSNILRTDASATGTRIFSIPNNSQNIQFFGTIQATTGKFTNLTDGYIPYHISDASGLGNSGLFWDATNSRLGIETTSPSEKLDVWGNINITDNSRTHFQVRRIPILGSPQNGTYKGYLILAKAYPGTGYVDASYVIGKIYLRRGTTGSGLLVNYYDLVSSRGYNAETFMLNCSAAYGYQFSRLVKVIYNGETYHAIETVSIGGDPSTEMTFEGTILNASPILVDETYVSGVTSYGSIGMFNNNGNICIGTVSLDAKLNVNGNAWISSGNVDGGELLRFSMDRGWNFTQVNTGPSTMLSLNDLTGYKAFRIYDSVSAKTMAYFTSGASNLYYLGNKVFETSANGVTISGSLIANTAQFTNVGTTTATHTLGIDANGLLTTNVSSGGATNLGYTSAASNGIVTSDTGTDATIPAATTSTAGLLTATDKTKLDGIATGADNYGSWLLSANDVLGSNYIGHNYDVNFKSSDSSVGINLTSGGVGGYAGYGLDITVPDNATKTWVSSNYDNYNGWYIDVNTTSRFVTTSGHVNLIAGTGMTITPSGNDITFASTGGYTLPLAANGTRGGLQIGYTATGANIPLQLSSEKGYVALTQSAVVSALGSYYLLLTGGNLTGPVTSTSTYTGTNFILSSDIRLKKQIKPISIPDLHKIKFKQFVFKNDTTERLRYGVIAQDVEKVAPNLVYTDKNGQKSVAYIDLLIAKIAELEARIKKLEDEK